MFSKSITLTVVIESTKSQRYYHGTLVSHSLRTSTMVNPREYEVSDTLQKLKVSKLIDEFAEELITMSGKCMDIGCGPGDITKDMLLPAISPNTVMIGTDISDSMIDYANRKNSIKNRLSYEVLDIQTRNLSCKYISDFDHIFSFHALHWCSDIRQAFENIYRMLRPGGTMLVLLVASHDIFDVFRMLSRDSRYAPYIPDAGRLVSPFQDSQRPHKEVKDMLRSIGFNVRQSSTREANYVSGDSQEFLSSITAFVQLAEDMPESVVQEFYNDFAREYMYKKMVCNKQQQTVVLDLYKLLVIYAEKPLTCTCI